MKMIIGRILVWLLIKLKISVMIGVEINTKEQYCKSKWNKSIIGFSTLNGVGLLWWKRCFFCHVKNTHFGFDSREKRGPIDKNTCEVMGIVIEDVKEKITIKNLELSNIRIVEQKIKDLKESIEPWICPHCKSVNSGGSEISSRCGKD
jgi:hypothetical protein